MSGVSLQTFEMTVLTIDQHFLLLLTSFHPDFTEDFLLKSGVLRFDSGRFQKCLSKAVL